MPEFRGNSCRPSSRYFTQTVSVKTPAVKMRASGGVCLFPSFWPKACMAEAECVHMCLCVKDACVIEFVIQLHHCSEKAWRCNSTACYISTAI